MTRVQVRYIFLLPCCILEAAMGVEQLIFSRALPRRQKPIFVISIGYLF